MIHRLAAFALLVASLPAFAADPLSPVVVELFTSEGCSSCPPADKFLADLVASNAPGRPEVIALGEHVDYWNHDGWTDRFSSDQFTYRQKAYDQRFKLEEPYTPQIVIDGMPQTGGSKEILRGIVAASQQPALAKIDMHWNSGSPLQIDVQSQRPSGDVFLAITEDGLKTDVLAGENHGRTLTHAAVVRRLQKVGSLSKGTFSKQLTLPLDKSWDLQHSKAVVFVQEKNEGPIIGAAYLSLAPESISR